MKKLRFNQTCVFVVYLVSIMSLNILNEFWTSKYCSISVCIYDFSRVFLRPNLVYFVVFYCDNEFVLLWLKKISLCRNNFSILGKNTFMIRYLMEKTSNGKECLKTMAYLLEVKSY